MPFCSFDYRCWYSREFRDVETVAFARSASDYLFHEDDFFLGFIDAYGKILHAGQCIFELNEFMIMRRYQGFRSDFRDEIFQYRFGQCESVVGRGSTS